MALARQTSIRAVLTRNSIISRANVIRAEVIPKKRKRPNHRRICVHVAGLLVFLLLHICVLVFYHLILKNAAENVKRLFKSFLDNRFEVIRLLLCACLTSFCPMIVAGREKFHLFQGYVKVDTLRLYVISRQIDSWV